MEQRPHLGSRQAPIRPHLKQHQDLAERHSISIPITAHMRYHWTHSVERTWGRTGALGRQLSPDAAYMDCVHASMPMSTAIPSPDKHSHCPSRSQLAASQMIAFETPQWANNPTMTSGFPVGKFCVTCYSFWFIFFRQDVLQGTHNTFFRDQSVCVCSMHSWLIQVDDQGGEARKEDSGAGGR